MNMLRRLSSYSSTSQSISPCTRVELEFEISYSIQTEFEPKQIEFNRSSSSSTVLDSTVCTPRSNYAILICVNEKKRSQDSNVTEKDINHKIHNQSKLEHICLCMNQKYKTKAYYSLHQKYTKIVRDQHSAETICYHEIVTVFQIYVNARIHNCLV